MLRHLREEAGQSLPEAPDYEVHEVHACLLCQGERDKEAKRLSFSADKIMATRQHYISCLYDFGFFREKYYPTSENINEDGSLKDVLGTIYKYPCKLCPNSKDKDKFRKGVGYSEYTRHMAREHGGLEDVLRGHAEEKVRALVHKLRK